MRKWEVVEQEIFFTDEEIFRANVITPRDFIHMLVDLCGYEPGLGGMGVTIPDEAEYVRLNKPRRVRFQRLYSLLRAYDLIGDLDLNHPLHSFINGEFIDEYYTADPYLNDKLRESWEMLDAERIINYIGLPIGEFSWYRLQNFFESVMKYRLGLSNTDSYFSGFLIMGAGISHAARLAEQLQEMFIDPVKDIIDDTLIALLYKDTIKPYTAGELIDKYGYPPITDEQLADIDMDHF